jgi:hypothetical protein
MTPCIVNGQIIDIPFNRALITKNPQSFKIEYVYIDSVKGISKEDLYSNALEWIALNFKDANSVIKLQDRVAGKIVTKGLSRQNFAYKWLGNNMITEYSQFYTIDLSFKEDKFKIVFTDFVAKIDASGSGYTYTPSFEVSAEEYLSLIPEVYDFETMSRGEKQSIVTKKQILSNTYHSSRLNYFSLKRALTKKNDW